jgi:hypothetical protein
MVFLTRRIGASAGVVLAAAIAITFIASHDASAAPFGPSLDFKMCNGLASDFPTTESGSVDADLAGDPGCIDTPIPAYTADDSTSTFNIPAGSSNLGSWLVTNTTGYVAADAAIPDGEKVGGLRLDSTLSLLNGNCATSLIEEFILYDAETTGATVNPASEGILDRFSNLVTDADDDGFADPDSPGITSNIGMYEEIFTPEGGVYIPPLARYTGISRIPLGEYWQIVSVFIFEAGALDAFATDAADEPNQLGRVSHAPSTGYVSITIVGDPTAVQVAPSPIHEFCSPVTSKTMLLGQTPNGSTRYTTPRPGTLGYSAFTFGERDADGDGVANSEDGCPFVSGSADADLDAIPDACDPTPGTNTGSGDHDGDGFVNRQDNCPLVANGGASQVDSEISESWIDTAPDAGPKADSIGDACDPNPLTSYSEGDYVSSYTFVPRCIGGTDADGDGFCSGQDLDDSDDGTGGWTLNRGMDVEYPGLDGGHGDGGGGNWELYWGTDPLTCDPPSGWPPDLVVNGTVNIADVLSFKVHFGSSYPAPAFDPRWDLNPDKTINIADVLALKFAMGHTCG